MSRTPTRVLVCGHDLKFLQPLLSRLEQSPAYELRTLVHSGHHLRDHAAAERELAWAQVVFCEWALDNAVWFSQRKLPGQVLIVRLHLQEVQARERIDFIYATDWSKVDRLILITQHLYDWMRQEFPVLASRAALVYNPIPAARSLNLPKATDTRHVLGLVGVVPARKRLDLAVAVLKLLRQRDPRYVLRVKGALPQNYAWMADRKDEMAWYSQVFGDLAELRLAGAVVFDPHGPDMAAWYQSVGHILSVSDFEGSHQAVAEGMAAGCVPAIRDWEGAARIYPAQYVARTVEDLAALIFKHTGADVFEHESDVCRRFSAERFDETPVCDALLSIINQELRRRGTAEANRPSPPVSARPTFLIVAYVPFGARSGYRIRVEQEIQILVRLGCIVHLACLCPPATINGDVELQRARDGHVAEFSALGARVHLVEIEDIFRLRVDANSFPAAVVQLTDIARRCAVDVLHAEALYCARVAAQVAARMPGLRFTIDWHGAVPEESRMGGAHAARVQALEQSEQDVLKQSDLNVFVSEAMAQHYLSKYRLNSLPQVMVPCCVSDQRFVDPWETVQPAFGGDSLVFAYAGSMADWQCGPEMITLFAHLHRFDPRCRFLLLVPTSDHAKVVQLAQAANLPQSAYVLQAVSHEQVPARLATAHMGLLLRHTDVVNAVSSPTKFGEYLAAGLPVLTTEGIGDFSGLVAQHAVGLILPQALLNDGAPEVYGPWLPRIIAEAESSRSARRETARHCQMVARAHLQWEPSALSWLAALKHSGIESNNDTATSTPV